MLKKPIFWIIVIIVIVVLWFVFSSRGGHTTATPAPATSSQPADHASGGQ